MLLQDLNYEFKDLLAPRNIAAVVAVLKSKATNLSWFDVKVQLLKSLARGNVSQSAASSMFSPRIEASGRRYYCPKTL